MKKTLEKILLEFEPGSDLCEFFSRFSPFSKFILLICSNLTILYITVPENSTCVNLQSFS